MKVRLTQDYSDEGGFPGAGDVLEVYTIEHEENGDLDFYVCKWDDEYLVVYPYECEELL